MSQKTNAAQTGSDAPLTRGRIHAAQGTWKNGRWGGAFDEEEKTGEKIVTSRIEGKHVGEGETPPAETPPNGTHAG